MSTCENFRKKPGLFRSAFYRYCIRKYLYPFLEKERKNLERFERLNEETPKKVLDVINALKAYGEKYHFELLSFEKIKQDIFLHNLEIERLRSYQFKASYKDFVMNPLIYKRRDFDEDFQISEEINKYKDVDVDVLQKSNDILKLIEDYDLINQQYALLNKYNDFLRLEDVYYDSAKRNLLKKKMNLLKNQLSSQKRVYDFPFLDDERLDGLLDEHNKSYVQKHINDSLFDEVNGRSLDFEQRSAVLEDESSALTIAGAGSGKTLTICGKLKFLFANGVNPSEILLLSYSRKSANDLKEKIKDIDSRLTADTFHKVGLKILEETYHKKFMVEDQLDAIIESYFRDKLPNDQKEMKNVLQYYALYLDNDEGEKFETDGELFENLKDCSLTTLKDLSLKASWGTKKLTTIKKEKVKSIEELKLANFYFINGIEYIYEKPYEQDVSDSDHRQYKPDFYLKDYGIYHEHYGIDENGEASQYSGEKAQKYIESLEWKRSIHELYGTKCIETFSYDFADGTIFEKLTASLKESGVRFKPLDNRQIKAAIESIYENRSFKSFIRLVKSFINLYKSKYTSSSAFETLKNSTFSNPFQKIRASMFLNICKKVYEYYVDYLQKEQKIDFDDMILKSKEALFALDAFRYKYIIVDEFQDISYSRVLFLKALIEHGRSKLFAVGDDWQSIYRFSGCDLGLFLGFKDFFPNGRINFITRTYRNSQELEDIASSFIQKNPDQIKKLIKSEKRLQNPIKIVYFDNDKRATFKEILRFIHEINSEGKVLILGRNNRDLETVLDNDLIIKKTFEDGKYLMLFSKKYPSLSLEYSTVHSSKGLEEEFVVLINADDDKTGFPNKTEDDPVLDLVLSSKDEVKYAEERRLWYVALTRTKSYCYILTNSSRPSVFIDEIKEQCEIIGHAKTEDISGLLCPCCETGKLIQRKDSEGKTFYRCSNYPFCDYMIRDEAAVHRNLKCPVCGDFLIVRKGKYGSFYGCHRYPFCTYKRKIGH